MGHLSLLSESASPRLATWTCLLLCVVIFGRVVAQGALIRWRMYRLKRAGYASGLYDPPILEPYSLLWGHLQTLPASKKSLPPDAHDVYTTRLLLENWQKHFPNAKECPPLIYLDLWPFMSELIVSVVDPDLCAEITQRSPLPRSPIIRQALDPLTSGRDIISVGPGDHKLWKERFNPSFSPRNIASNVPEIVDQVATFTAKIRSHVGKDGGWGDVFTLYDMSVSLTFDIIAYLALGLQLHEQTDGPGPVRTALRSITRHIKQISLLDRIARMKPKWKREIAESRKTLRDAMLPSILDSISKMEREGSQFQPKTAAEFALRDFYKDGEKSSTSRDEFIETVLANATQFFFAGHDTTAQSICWILYECFKHPEIVQRIREEYASVIGEGAQAYETIRQQPRILNSLPYSTAVVRETLRLHNLGSSNRQGQAGVHLVHKGRKYPTYDSVVVTAPDAMSYRPNLWPRPKEFIPERYLVGEGHELRPVPNSWRPFELGNTRCIGEELAWTELKLALMLVVGEFDLEFPPPQSQDSITQTVEGEHVYRCGFTVGWVKDDLPSRVKLRKT